MQELLVWYPLASRWWQAWKAYTKYEDPDGPRAAGLAPPDDDDGVVAQPPGPIDNSSLRGAEPDELKQDLGEGEDFVLLPQAAYELLEGWYGGGPRFKRVVLAEGASKPPKLIVELYPIRFRTFRCLPNGEPDLSSRQSMLFSRSYTMSQVRAHVLNALNVRAELARFFVKTADPGSDTVGPDLDPSWVMVDGANAAAAAPAAALLRNGDASASVTASASAAMDVEQENDGSAGALQAGGAGSAASSDEDDGEGGWQLVKDLNSNCTLDDLLEKMQGIVYLLVDVRESENAPYPREMRWRRRLKPGDMLDARDSDNSWLEARVVSISEDSDQTRVKIHFMGWASKWDQDEDLSSPNLQPLHTHTVSWRRDIAPGYKLELRKLDAANTYKWYKGVVIEVNREGPDGGSIVAEFDHSVTTGRITTNIISDDINLLGTHIKEEVLTNNRSQASGENRYGASSSSSSSTFGSGWYNKRNTEGTPPCRGVVGLANLGNTCFMNSTLQCLSNTEPLTRWFLNKNYVHDLNENNPLGMNGKVALSYAQVLEDLWSDRFVTVVPADLKRTIGQLQTQFAGFQQHDSQELMNFLLDGLHEDLNRIHKKPTVSKLDSDGRPDEVVAAESWDQFMMRNDSILVDCCYGLLKSHLTCPVCSFESVTFDPYALLSVPLPVEDVHKLSATLVLLPYGRAFSKVVFAGPATATVGDFKRWLAEKVIPELNSDRGSGGEGSRVNPKQLIVVELNYNKISSVRTDAKPITDIKSHESIWVFQVEGPPPLPPPGPVTRSSHYNSVSSSGPTIVIAPSGIADVQAPAAAAEGAVSMEIDEDVPSVAAREGAAAAAAAAAGGASSSDALPAVPEPPPLPGSSSQNKTEEAGVEFDVAIPGRYNVNVLSVPMLRAVLPAPVTNAKVHEVVRQYIRRYYRPDASPKPKVITSSFWRTGTAAPPAAAAAAASAMDGGQPGAMEQQAQPQGEQSLGYKVVVGLRQQMLKTERALPDDGEEFEAPAFAKELVTVVFDERGWSCFEESPANDYVEHASVAEAAKPPKPILLSDCFDKFMEREQLSDKDPWYCSRCKEHREAFKQMSLWTTPDVLIVHLKRFQYLPGAYGSMLCRSKLDALVDFPVEGLDLSRYLDAVGAPQFPDHPPIYDLYGVSEHMGSLRGGHYTAVARNFLNKTWYSFNDSHVSETRPEEAVSPKAYVLFYRRRSPTALRWGGMTTHTTYS